MNTPMIQFVTHMTIKVVNTDWTRKKKHGQDRGIKLGYREHQHFGLNQVIEDQCKSVIGESGKKISTWISLTLRCRA